MPAKDLIPLDLIIEGILTYNLGDYQTVLDQIQNWMDEGDVTGLIGDFLQRLRGKLPINDEQRDRMCYVLTLIFLHRREVSPATAEALSGSLVQLFAFHQVLLKIAIEDNRALWRIPAIQYIGEHQPWLFKESEQFRQRLRELKTKGETPEQMAAAIALTRIREFFRGDSEAEELFDDTLHNSGSFRVQDLLRQAKAAHKTREEGKS